MKFDSFLTFSRRHYFYVKLNSEEIFRIVSNPSRHLIIFDHYTFTLKYNKITQELDYEYFSKE
jgi:hypothetical protein